MDQRRVFELRTYTAAPGKFAALEQRFRDHTIRLFERHGIDVIGFFVPVDASDTLVYLLAFANEEAAVKCWEEFRADPEWISAYEASQVDGTLVAKIESRVMTPTQYSPLF